MKTDLNKLKTDIDAHIDALKTDAATPLPAVKAGEPQPAPVLSAHLGMVLTSLVGARAALQGHLDNTEKKPTPAAAPGK